jgi:(p)ppGpp synthase/HD superfamily hydrolase
MCARDASRLHAGQYRADGSPYIVHPLRVAILTAASLSSPRQGTAVLIALMHDVIEDCGIAEDWIANRYGSFVADAVGALSAPAPQAESREERWHRKVAKWEALKSADVVTLTVHAMDVLDNTISWRFIVRDMIGWQKLPRWMWQLEEYQIPLLTEHLPGVVDELMAEVRYERARGVEVGRWDSP